MNDSTMTLTNVRWSGFLLYPLHGDAALMNFRRFEIGIPNLSFLNSFGKVGGNIHGGGGGTGPNTSCRRLQIPRRNMNDAHQGEDEKKFSWREATGPTQRPLQIPRSE